MLRVLFIFIFFRVDSLEFEMNFFFIVLNNPDLKIYMYQQVFEIYGRTVNCKLESSVNVRRSLNYPTRTWRHQKCSRSWYKFSILVLIELNHICDRITYIFPNSIHLETVQFNLLSFNTEVVHLSSCTARKSCVSSLILYVYMVL